jgi:hypothetical protein
VPAVGFPLPVPPRLGLRLPRKACSRRGGSALPLEPDPELTPELHPELNPEVNPGPKRGRKFYLALACYGAIALLAASTLDGKFRWVVWIFLGGLALKTYIATLKQP